MNIEYKIGFIYLFFFLLSHFIVYTICVRVDTLFKNKMSFKLYSKSNAKSRRKSYPQYQPIPKSIDREFKLTLDVFDTKEDCPARIRPNWPKEIIPWWTPSHANEKPPYSYATLIAHAILTSQEGRLTLNDIYLWISDHYKAYSIGVGGWQVKQKMTCVMT